MTITETDRLLPPITNRDEWLTWRRTGIGASDVAGILNLSPWATPWSIWADKVGLADPDVTEVTAAMMHGTWAERAIGPWFEERTGMILANQQHCAVGAEPWHLATLDGIGHTQAGRQCVVEMKATADSPKTWADDGIPVHYQCQGTWQSIVTGIPNVKFAVLHVTFGRLHFEVYDYTPDDSDRELVLDGVTQFWHDHVLTGNPPPVDARPPTTEAIKNAWGGIDDADDTLLADDRLVDLHESLVAIRAEIADLDQHKTLLENEIKARMADCAVLTHDGAPLITWKPVTSHRLDSKALRAEKPDIAAEFTTTTTARTFLVKTPNKEK